jgi:hypothetical protein
VSTTSKENEEAMGEYDKSYSTSRPSKRTNDQWIGKNQRKNNKLLIETKFTEIIMATLKEE